MYPDLQRAVIILHDGGSAVTAHIYCVEVKWGKICAGLRPMSLPLLSEKARHCQSQEQNQGHMHTPEIPAPPAPSLANPLGPASNVAFSEGLS